MSAIAAPFPVARRGVVLPGLRARLRRVRAALAGFGNAVENKVLDHLTGVAAYPSPAPLFVGLVTVAVGETDTGSTVTEPTYTGYARLRAAATDWAGASGGVAATRVIETFADCTSGSGTVIGWFLTPASSGAGDVVMYGTCTSVTISTTQTPPSVASGALSMALD